MLDQTYNYGVICVIDVQENLHFSQYELCNWY